jgi:hypothetical protein
MLIRHLMAIAASASLLGLVGCSGTTESTNPVAEATEEKHTHGEWWCDEHGVPEEICALCSTRVAADFKVKGDWCEEHDRPDSQCFICHPEKEAEFAALYEAKYGKKPPKPEGEEHEHHDHEEKS